MYVILGLGIREKSDEVSQHRSLSYIFHCSFSMPYQVLPSHVVWRKENEPTGTSVNGGCCH